MSALADAAIEYASLGKPVLPVGANKKPLTKHGLLDATTTLTTVERWWELWPTANIAIRTGAISDLVVIDVDNVGDDLEPYLAWDRLQDQRDEGDRVTQPHVVTPRGGYHYYFRHPGVPVKTIAPPDSFHVRGDGGYVVVPPSTNYHWASTTAPAPWQPWMNGLLDKVREEGEHEATPPEEWVQLFTDLRHGRNPALTRITGLLLRRYVPVDVTAMLVHAVNQTYCHPPKPRAEVDYIIDSVAGRELRRRTAR